MIKEKKRKTPWWKYVLAALFLFLAFGFSLFAGRLFLADISFAEGRAYERAADYHSAAESFRKAVKLNPHEPAYHRELASALAHRVKEQLLSEAGSAAVLTAVQLAQEGGREAFQAYRLNPFNSLTLKSILKTYYELANYFPVYQAEAEKVGDQLIELSPTEARSRYSVALVYAAGGKNERALKLAQTAVNLKPNFDEAKKLVAILEGVNNTEPKSRSAPAGGGKEP